MLQEYFMIQSAVLVMYIICMCMCDRQIFEILYIIQFTICVICNNKHEWKCSSEKCGVASLNYGENNFMVNKILITGIVVRTKRSECLHRESETDCKTDCFAIPVKQRFSRRRNVASSVLRRPANFSPSPRDPVIQRGFRVFVTRPFFSTGWASLKAIWIDIRGIFKAT